MKALTILALLFGLGATGSSVYAMVETKPNYDSNAARMDDTEGKSDKLTNLDRLVYEDYAKALGREVVGSWAGGLLSIVLGALGLKRGNKALAIVAILLGLAGAGLAFAVMPQPLVL